MSNGLAPSSAPYVVLRQHPDPQVGETDGADNRGDPTQQVDHPVPDDGDDQCECAEDDDADRRGVNVEDFIDRLTRKHCAGGRKAQIHQYHQDQRQTRSPHTELGAAGNHLRDAHFRALRRVQCHHYTAADVANQQADDRPQRVRTEYHCQRTVDDRGDLHVCAEPQRELIARRSVPLTVRNHVDRAALNLNCHIECSLCVEHMAQYSLPFHGRSMDSLGGSNLLLCRRRQTSRRCSTRRTARRHDHPEPARTAQYHRPAMPDEIEKAIGLAERDPAIKVIVLRGAGRAFSGGYDFGGGFKRVGRMR